MNETFDRDDIRALASLVGYGECITFPNGVTIDKRPVVTPPTVMPPAWWGPTS